jgi:hypothetical protein
MLAVFPLALAVAACSGQVTPTATGIQGHVEESPTCPVERINSPCPPKPLAATVIVRRGASEVLRFRSSSDGSFKVELPPGTYSLVGLQSGVLPRPIATEVVVVAGHYTQVTVEYDSGIR